MPRPDHAISLELEVPFHDCDPLFVVWHGRYFQYVEKARTELFRAFGIDVPEFRKMGYRLFVTDLRCRYMFPLRYADQFRVNAWLTETSPFVRMAFTVDNLTAGRKAARGYTVLATTDEHGTLLPKTPDDLEALLPR